MATDTSTSTSTNTGTGTGTGSNHRTTKPGKKRLVLTVSVLLSFLFSAPFLLQSTEIHRSPIPAPAISSLAGHLQSRPPSFPSHLRVVFLSPPSKDPHPSPLLPAAIADKLRSGGSCGSCNFTVSVSVDSGPGLVDAIGSRDDREIDELLLLQSAADETEGGCVGRVYTVFVMEGEEERVVVGKHWHAWVVVKVLDDSESVGSVIGAVFGDYFMRGGVGVGEGEYVPVGSDGNVVLSFSLLNSDPSDWVYDW